MSEKFYLTTAIDYPNGEPHIGHAFEKIGADCIARYRRLRGQRVHFVMGMDENSQNVVELAAAAGLSPWEWIDRLADRFRATWQKLSISYDDFIRTTEERHRRAVIELLHRIEKQGYIYRGTYRGYYCTGCEAFKLEKDLEQGRCPLHPTLEMKWVEESNYFFKLSAFAEQLLEIYRTYPDYVRPEPKLNEIRNVVQSGLQDQSISRARLAWGIPWPGDEQQRVYVWFDALINYLSATGFPQTDYENLWPADLHIIGPDILRFHAAIWPAMLLAAKLPIPRGIWSHGWVNFSGRRFSKTAGVRVELNEAIDRYGPDPFRYFLLREVPWDGSGDFTWERFDARYEADLANGFGNLTSRTVAMTARYCSGRIPDGEEPTPLDNFAEEVIENYRQAMDRHLLHQGAQAIWRLVSRANAFVEETAPWNLIKAGNTRELERSLAALARALARIALLVSPFMPHKAREAWSALGLPDISFSGAWHLVLRPPVGGRLVTPGPPLFPKPRVQRVTT